MKQSPVLIKYSKDILTLKLSPEEDFMDIVKIVCRKFAESRKFFGKGDYILTIEDRELSSNEEKAIVDSIELNSDVRIRFILAPDNGIKEIKVLEELEKFKTDELLRSAVLIKGSIGIDKEKSFDTSVIILGDVKEGAKVTSKGNVVVFGAINGQVHAGYPNLNNAFIACTSIGTEPVSIGGISAVISIKKKWGSRKTTKDEINYGIIQFDGQLLCEPLKSGILKQL